MFVKDQLGERIVNLKYMKEIYLSSTHPSNGFIEVVDDRNTRIVLGVYSSLEKAQEDMNGLNAAMSQKEKEDFVYPLKMDEYVDLEKVKWTLHRNGNRILD